MGLNVLPITMTDLGQAAISQVLADNKVLEFTAAILSTDIYDEDDIPALTDLTNKNMTGAVVDLVVSQDKWLQINCEIPNTYLTQSFTMQSVGVYVNDVNNNDLLAFVAIIEEGATIDPPTGGLFVNFLLNFIVTMTKTPNVSISVQPRSLATVKYVQEYTESLVNQYLDTYFGDTVVIVSTTQPVISQYPGKKIVWVKR
jgi:hypothetical protein